MAPLVPVKHVVKFDFQVLASLIGCRRESLQRKADYTSWWAHHTERGVGSTVAGVH